MTSPSKANEALTTNKSKHQSGNPLMRWSIQQFHRTVRDLLPDVTNVLEVGCGEGFSTQAVLSGHRELTGFGGDIDREAVAEARIHFPSAHYSVFDATRLPFPDNSVDAIFSLEVLEHLPDPVAAVREFQRVSRRYMLLSVPNEPVFRIQRMLSGKGIRQWGDHPEHVNHWSLWGFQRFIAEQGIFVEQAVSPPPFAWSILLCKIAS